MTSIPPAGRFHRIIKKLGRFAEAVTADLSDSYTALLGGERPLGVYRGDTHSDDILFTEYAFIFTDSNGLVRRIAYAEIQTVKYPLPASESIDLAIQLTDALTITIRVVGRQGNFRDVFEVGRFFMRVAEDAGKGCPLPP